MRRMAKIDQYIALFTANIDPLNSIQCKIARAFTNDYNSSLFQVATGFRL